MYIPLYNDREKKYFTISFKKLFIFTASLPLIGFFSCVLITMYKDFDIANNTHCKVPNVFPSISASVGAYEPQKFIWKTAIYLHAPARFVTIFLRYKHYQVLLKHSVNSYLLLTVILNIIENVCLIGLTYWNSSENYPYHEKSFKTFIGTSIFYMLFLCILLTKYRRNNVLTTIGSYSLRLKWRFFIINVISFSLAAYCFIRHNKYCEPYVYSVFAAAEYIVVVTNMGFHMTTIYDFHRKSIVISNDGLHLS